MQLISIFKQLPAEAEPLVLELTGRIGKLRALDEEESKLLEEAIRRESRRNWQAKGPHRHVWTAKEDRLLISHGATTRGLETIAAKIGVTYSAAKTRRSCVMNGKRKTQLSQTGREGV